jgi:Rab-GTPase-TBC domain
MEAKAEKPGKNIDDVIEIDVQRSFNNHQNCDPLVKRKLKIFNLY